MGVLKVALLIVFVLFLLMLFLQFFQGDINTNNKYIESSYEEDSDSDSEIDDIDLS